MSSNFLKNIRTILISKCFLVYLDMHIDLTDPSLSLALISFEGSDEEGSSMNNGCSRGAVDSMQPPTRSSMTFLPGGGSDGVSSSSSQQGLDSNGKALA